MSINRCLYYKGKYYDIGTKVKIKTKRKGEIVTIFRGFRRYDGLTEHDYYSGMSSEYYIVEIIEPVYYKEPEPDSTKKANAFMQTGSGSWNSHDDVFHGFLLYIAVMLGGIIFNDRWLIWIIATVIFFGWKKKK